MANLKFDRIFGTSAKSTQEFTDTEYSRGWGFLGQEPPPYELFDDFFKKTDLKLKDLNDRQLAADSNLSKHNTSSSAHADIRQLFKNYLPLTGGTVTGRLYVNDAVFMGTETSQYGNFIERTKAGTMYLASGKSENSNLSWFNVDGYFKYIDTAEMCVIKRDENANILAKAYLLDKDNKTRFPGEVYSNEKLLAKKEYVDGKKWGSTSIIDGSVTPTKLDRAYLPLTGGTVSGRTHIDAMLSVGQSSAQASNIRVDGAAGNAYIALLNYNNAGSLLIDGYFNNPETANIDVTNRNAEGTVRYRSTLMDGDGNAKFANDVYANNKLLATKEYVDGKKWSSTSIIDGSITPTKLDRAYLPLTGGTITGRLHVNDLVSTGSDTMQFSNFIQTSLAGKAYLTTGKNNSDNWFNVDGYFNNPEQSNIGVLKRNANGDVIARAYLLHNDNKTYFPNEVYANNKLLATKEYVDTKGTNDLNVHNTSSSAHKPILDAIKAITGTSAFNTAPSKKITEIITLLGQGGIVSSKLDAAAGFVKFSNGFTIQWGKTPSTQTSSVIEGRNNKFTLDLPIRYATPFISIAIDFGNGAVGVSTTLTNTQVNAHANQTTLYWSYIAVGIA